MTGYDIVIIGGGASGLAAAISGARAGARVCVLERDVEAGLSILATGNGRCNISNAKLDARRYRHPEVVRNVFGARPEADIEAFFSSLGLMFAEEGEGRLYPITRRAESVRDVLLAACAREGVEICTCSELVSAHTAEGAVEGTNVSNRRWQLTVSEPAAPLSFKRGRDAKAAIRNARKAAAEAPRAQRTLNARAVIVACGGASEPVCEMLDIPHQPTKPILCPIACRLDHAHAPNLDTLDGLRLHAMLTLARGGAAVAFEEGEVLFRAYGISGIAAFNLSRRIQAGDAIELDLFPAMNTAQLTRVLQDRERAIGPYTGDPAWFDGLLARPLAGAICKLSGNSDQPLTKMAPLLHRLRLRVDGTTEHAQAQVQRGGIPFAAIDLDTLAVQSDTLAPGLFACGEALDMDADCGGYNLAWAWLTGIRAGTSAANAATRATDANVSTAHTPVSAVVHTRTAPSHTPEQAQ